MVTIDTARQWAAEARDDKWDKKCFALQRFMAGDPSYVSELFENGDFEIPGYQGEDMLEFPWTDPDIAMAGVQNHAYINARINVQGMVYATPEVLCSCQDPLIRKANASWFKQRYHQGGYSSKLFEIGMDVQAMGIGFADLGIGPSGASDIKHRSKLDTMVDPAGRSPEEWRYVWLRNRLDFYQAEAKYKITKEEFDQYARKESKSYTKKLVQTGTPPSYIYEWSFWSLDSHHVVLGSIKNKDAPIFILDAQNEYKRHDGPDSGPNPYGMIPLAVWIDSWMSGSLRPTGMLETAWRAASFLNLIELSSRETMMRGIPINIVSAAGMSDAVIKKLQEAKGPKDIEAIIMTELPNAAEAIHRIPASEIPQSYLAMYTYWRDQLNAATGVMDMQRGQALSGRKTAEEIRTLEDQQGIQAHHARQRLGDCLRQIFLKSRMIEAMFGTAHTYLEDDDFILDSEYDDISAVLSYPLDASIEESSLQYQSQEGKAQRRIIEFQVVDVPAIDRGVGNPEKIFADVYKSIGVVDPYSRMYTPEEMAANAQRQAMQMLPEQPGAEQEQGDMNG